MSFYHSLRSFITYSRSVWSFLVSLSEKKEKNIKKGTLLYLWPGSSGSTCCFCSHHVKYKSKTTLNVKKDWKCSEVHMKKDEQVLKCKPQSLLHSPWSQPSICILNKPLSTPSSFKVFIHNLQGKSQYFVYYTSTLCLSLSSNQA